MKHILIVEDDQKLNDGIRLALRKDYACSQVFTLQDARETFKVQHFDLIILDVNFPDGNGIDFLTEIRRESHIPVIVLTANNMETDIITGLEMGANDYITKPFSLMVLSARIGVQLREKERSSNIYKIDDFYFDFCRMEFLYKGETIDLSRTEQRLLRCLIEHKGNSVSRSSLIDDTWPGESEFVDEHALTVVINRLRKKLEDCNNQKEYIKTVYGIGYRFC